MFLSKKIASLQDPGIVKSVSSKFQIKLPLQDNRANVTPEPLPKAALLLVECTNFRWRCERSA